MSGVHGFRARMFVQFIWHVIGRRATPLPAHSSTRLSGGDVVGTRRVPYCPPRICGRTRTRRSLCGVSFSSPSKAAISRFEGLNNKAKLTMRKSYGFRTFRCLELALYHSLGKLPEPESTHDFF